MKTGNGQSKHCTNGPKFIVHVVRSIDVCHFGKNILVSSAIFSNDHDLYFFHPLLARFLIVRGSAPVLNRLIWIAFNIGLNKGNSCMTGLKQDIVLRVRSYIGLGKLQILVISSVWVLESGPYIPTCPLWFPIYKWLSLLRSLIYRGVNKDSI